jgi:hypothetical protein
VFWDEMLCGWQEDTMFFSIFRAILEMYWWQKTHALTLYSLLVLAELFGQVNT